MTEKEAWEATIKSLYRYYLQGNSHIDNIDQWIMNQIAKTIDVLREAKSPPTKDVVDGIVDHI